MAYRRKSARGRAKKMSPKLSGTRRRARVRTTASKMNNQMQNRRRSTATLKNRAGKMQGSRNNAATLRSRAKKF